MKRLIVILLIAFTVIFAFSSSALASQQAGEVIADIILVRPFSLAAVVIGAALFIVSLPFAAPSGSVSDTARVLVATPFNYTFTRPIGDFGPPPYYGAGYDSRTSSAPVAVNPPAAAVVPPPPVELVQPGKLFVYPRQGQPEALQKSDRDACHLLAVNQARYDPTNPAGGMPDAGKMAEYQRIMASCLEERGYAVR